MSSSLHSHLPPWDLTVTGHDPPPGPRDITKPIPSLWKVQDEDGEWVFGVPKWGFDEIVAGYACAKCLERFVTYLAACPICGTSTRQPRCVAIPEVWADKIKEWQRLAQTVYEEREQHAKARR